MDLSFDTEALRLVCESAGEARRQLPAPAAESLHAWLAAIRSAGSAADLRESGGSLDGEPPARIVFPVAGGYELVCVGNHETPVLAADGRVDYTRLRRLRVVAVSEQRDG